MAATAHPTEPAFDRDKAQQFADRMVGALNQSARRADDVDRPPHRPVRRHGAPPTGSPAPRSPRPPGSTSATCASGSARWSTGGRRRVRRGDRTYRLPPEHAACADPGGRSRQPRRHRRSTSPCWASVEDEIVDVLPQRRRRAVRALPRASTRSWPRTARRPCSPRCSTHILPLVPGLVDAPRAGIDVARRRLRQRPRA